MFASIRRHQKWLWIVIIVLVIFSFVIYFDPTISGRRGGGGGPRAGKTEYGLVNDRPLSREEFMGVYQDVRLDSLFGTGRWPEEDEATRQAFNVDVQIQKRLILLEKINQLNLQVSDEAVAEWIASSPAFRDPKTKEFRLDGYKRFLEQMLRPQNMTEADFQRYVRRQIGIEHLARLGGLSGGLVARADAEAIFRRENEQMSAQVVLFNFSNYLATATVNDAALAQFYTNNLARYRVPDRVQVSYVRFDATNFLAAADQAMALQTNLAVELQGAYQRRGADAFKGPDGKVMSQEAAIANMKVEMRREFGLVEARKQATAFAQQLFDLYEKQPAQTNNLERVAAALGLQATVTEPFSRTEGPAGIRVPDGFSQVAFALSPEQPMASEPIVSEDAAFVLALSKNWPSEVLPLTAVREKVIEDYRRRESMEAARQAGQAFYASVTNGSALHKTFDVVCAEAKVQPVLLPPFSLSTRSLRGWEGRLDLSLVKDIASAMASGGTSEFMATPDGGLVLHLISKQPVDEAVFKAELPAFTAQLRAMRERQAINDWLRRQADTVRLSGIPKFSRSKSAEAN